MELPDDEALVMVGGGKPIRAKKVRYFDDGSFTPLLSKPPTGTQAGVSTESDKWFRVCYEGGQESEAPLVPPAVINDEGVVPPAYETKAKTATRRLKVLKHPGATQSPEVVANSEQRDMQEDLA
jgi:type IV secretory pathway TraG/TraD family ATPase VirD4